jgi:LPS sulfotransferase NodH
MAPAAPQAILMDPPGVSVLAGAATGAASADLASPIAGTQPPVRVVVLTVPRTGSTMLCGLLGQFERAEMHFELFHETEIQFREGPVTDPKAFRVRNTDPVAFAEDIFAGAWRRGASLVGFKLFAFHDHRVLRRTVEDERTKIIVLSRSNTLAQYSSRRLAEATGAWQLEAGAKPERVWIPFDVGDFEAFEQAIHRRMREITVLLSEFGRQALFVEYTALRQDACIDRISDFLGLPAPISLLPTTVRQNPVRTIDRFKNREEVLNYLRARDRLAWAQGG